jgi:hypothetical protein
MTGWPVHCLHRFIRNQTLEDLYANFPERAQEFAVFQVHMGQFVERDWLKTISHQRLQAYRWFNGASRETPAHDPEDTMLVIDETGEVWTVSVW